MKMNNLHFLPASGVGAGPSALTSNSWIWLFLWDTLAKLGTTEQSWTRDTLEGLRKPPPQHLSTLNILIRRAMESSNRRGSEAAATV